MGLVQQFKCYAERTDERGLFLGVLNRGEWREINFFTTRRGATRGNHYSKNSREVVFLLKGAATVTLFHVDRPDERTTVSMTQGDGLEIPPFVVHTTLYTEDSEALALRDVPFDPHQPDLHKP